MRYCQGDKPPSEENPNKLAWMMFGEKNIVHGCAGIPGPHLHCTCKLCRADWYTALKEAR
jgi:hypothetical protein